MSAAKVVVVGSGVARLLGQAGVEHIHLVDPENLGWENIRRHELGARVVGHGKALALAGTIRADLPMIGYVEGYKMSFAAFAREHREALEAGGPHRELHRQLGRRCIRRTRPDATRP